ncbi:Rnh70 protein [Saccharomycopsis crataegensis]|uniref:Rnh70 protein n=1 Tax=Saccharomycopsis crataegensis TaxID=43959 RepID=A0AAV5QJX7_9ASCO|nr:Rnh70 protein [Saccharomycopsis crataegensis]
MGTEKTFDASGVQNEVARLSISTDIDRKQMVSMIKSSIAKSPRSKPAELVIDPNLVSRKISISDIRDLILFIFNELPSNIRWLSLQNHLNIKKAVFLCVPGIRGSDFGIKKDAISPQLIQANEIDKNLKPFKDFFKYAWPAKSPGSKQKLYSTFHTLVNVPMTRTKRKAVQKQQKQVGITLHDLILTVGQAIANKYPIHSLLKEKSTSDQCELIEELEFKSSSDGWVETEVFEHEGSKTFAVDCEMCLAGSIKVLTRVSLINFNNEILIDELVKPDEEITDYVTKYSGITEDLLRGVTTTRSEIQKKILSIVSADDVLIGHSLESDLNVLQIKHKTIVDTALIYDHTYGHPLKPSLKWLVQKFLNREIQNNLKGHDSVEDAKACMDLVKLKLQNGIEFGKTFSSTVEIFSRINSKLIDRCVGDNQAKDTSQEHNFDDLKSRLRKTLVVDYKKSGPIVGSPHNLNFGERMRAENDDEVVDTLVQNINNYDLFLGSLREAEFEFGWSEKPDTKNGEPADEKSQDTEKEKISPTIIYKNLSDRIEKVISSLPDSTLLVVSSSNGDPRHMLKLQNQKKSFQTDGGGSWTITDEDELMKAVDQARDCLLFIGLKAGGDSIVKGLPALHTQPVFSESAVED